jgi:hypothetical protein
MIVGVEMECPKKDFERVDCSVYIANGKCPFSSKEECVAYHLGSLRVVP